MISSKDSLPSASESITSLPNFFEPEDKSGDYGSNIYDTSNDQDDSTLSINIASTNNLSSFEFAKHLLLLAQEYVKVYNSKKVFKILSEHKELFNSFSKLKNEQGLYTNYAKGFIYYKLYLFDDALKAFKDAEECGRDIILSSSNAEDFRSVFNMTAAVYSHKNDYKTAFKYSDMALSIIEEYFRDSMGEWIPTNTIRAALLYDRGSAQLDPKQHLVDLIDAEKLLMKILELRKKGGDERMIGFTYLQMTQLYIKWSNLDSTKLQKAKECNREAFRNLEIGAPVENDCMTARNWFHKGHILQLETKHSNETARTIEAKGYCVKGIQMIGAALPSGNIYNDELKDKYRKIFGEEYLFDVLDIEEILPEDV